MSHAFDKFRPSREGDEEGGFVETLGDAVTIFGDLRVHKGETTVIHSRHSDVKVEDIFRIEDGLYRVKRIDRNPISPKAFSVLEKIKKPIEPAASETTV